MDLGAVDERGEGEPLGVVVRSRWPRPVCDGCKSRVWSKGYRSVVLGDLPAFGRPVQTMCAPTPHRPEPMTSPAYPPP